MIHTVLDERSFPYCPRCGTHARTNTQDPLHCSVCGLVWYAPTRSVVSIIVVNAIGEILCIKRARNPYKDTWDIPAGFVNIGETLEQAAHRELYEETHLQSVDLRYFMSFPEVYEYSQVITHLVGATYYCKTDQVPVPGDDASQVQFFALPDIPWGMIGFPSIKQVLQKWVNAPLLT